MSVHSARSHWPAGPVDEPHPVRSPVKGAVAVGSPHAHPPVVPRPGIRLLHVLQVMVACLAWLCCSSGIIIVNRYIMVELSFSYPMALSCWGQVVSGSAAWVICDVLQLVPPVDHAFGLRFFLLRVAPVGAMSGLTLWLSNSLYLHLTVAFIEMARSLLPLFTMLALFLAGLESPNAELVKAVCATAVGCALSAYGEVALTLLGILFLVGNFALEAGRLVMMQFLLQGCDFSPWQSLKLIAWPSAATLLVMSLALEYGDIAASGAGEVVREHWPYFLAAGALGLAVNFLSSVIIKLSSATTVKLLAAVRGPVVVLSGVVLFEEQVGAMQLLGYCLALAGFIWYNLAKAKHMPPRRIRKG